MSDSDDKIFDEYLRRQSPVSQRYRELDGDAVPPALDERILAQARAANRSPVNSKAWVRWTKPFALAASVALVVMVTVKIGTQQNAVTTKIEAPAITVELPPTPQVQQALPAEVAVPTAPATAPKSVKPASAIKKNAQPKQPAPPSSSPVEAKTTDDLSLAEVIETVPATPPAAARRDSNLQKTPVSIQAAEKALAAQNVSMVKDISAEQREQLRIQSDPELWLERIRTLRKEGKTQAADEEWKRFVEAWPNYPVAEADTAKGGK